MASKIRLHRQAVNTGLSSDLAADTIYATQIVSRVAGTIDKVWVYLDGLGAGAGAQQLLKAVIYLGSSTPTTILAVSSQVAVADNQAAGWVAFSFASPFAVSAESHYSIGIICGDSANVARLFRSGVSATSWTASDEYDDGPANVSTVTPQTYSYCIYADLTPTSVVIFGNAASILTTGSYENLGANELILTKVILDEGAIVSGLSVYCSGLAGGAGDQNIVGLIYADNAGAPGALITNGATDPLLIPNGSAGTWRSLTFGTPPSLTAGSYWLGVYGGPVSTTEVARFRYLASGGPTGVYSVKKEPGGTYPTPPNPLTGPTSSDLMLLIYATYSTPAVHLYYGGVSEGGQDGTEVSEGSGLAPIDGGVFTQGVDTTGNPVLLAVRTTGPAWSGDFVITPTGPNYTKWRLALTQGELSSATWGESLTISGVDGTNTLFYAQARALLAEGVQTDTGVDLVFPNF